MKKVFRSSRRVQPNATVLAEFRRLPPTASVLPPATVAILAKVHHVLLTRPLYLYLFIAVPSRPTTSTHTPVGRPQQPRQLGIVSFLKQVKDCAEEVAF